MLCFDILEESKLKISLEFNEFFMIPQLPDTCTGILIDSRKYFEFLWDSSVFSKDILRISWNLSRALNLRRNSFKILRNLLSKTRLNC